MIYNYLYINENGEEIFFSPKTNFIALKVEGLNGHTLDIMATKGINQIGNSVNNINVDSKLITINGVLKGETEYNRKRLIDVISPQSKGCFKAINKNGDQYSVDVYVKNTPIIGFGSNYQTFQFVLYCEYPYWKKNETIKRDINKIIPCFRFPFNLKNTLTFGKNERSDFININNNGNIKIPLKIVLTAKTSIENPKVINVLTGEQIKLNYTTTANEIITITTGYNNKRITSNISGDIFKHLDLLNSTFLQLEKGDNTFKFTADSNEDKMEIVIYYDEVVSSI